MAQVLYYWQCWVNEIGQHSYESFLRTETADFENANYNWASMDLHSADTDNSLFIYHCGVSVDMNYGHEGSSAGLDKAEYALQTYFGFKDQADLKSRINHPFDWKSILIANLNKGWPIIYQGQDDVIDPEDCHAWVIDGYDSSDKFSCNWGWDGTDNGYFSLGDFKPGSYNFTELQKALVDIEPQRTAGISTPQLTAQTFTYNLNGYNLTIPAVDGATSYEWITDHGTITGTGTTANLYSDCSAIVQVRAYNYQCRIYSGYASGQVTINYESISGPTNICSSGGTFTLISIPPVNSIVWSCGSGLLISSGQNTTTCTFSANGSYSGNSSVSVKLVTNGCGDIYLPQKSVWVGLRFIFSGSTYVNSGGLGTWTASEATSNCTPPYNYEWLLRESIESSAVVVGTTNPLKLKSVPRLLKSTSTTSTTLGDPTSNTIYFLSLRVTDANNKVYTTSEKQITAYGNVDLVNPFQIEFMAESSLHIQMLILPNPASDEVSIDLIETSDRAIDADTEWKVEIFDAMQSLKVKIPKVKGSKQTIRTTGWKEGVYIVRIKVGNEIISDKLLIKP